MSVRIHLIVDEQERDAFRAQAARQGVSLGEWLRQAGRDRLERERPKRLRTAEDLDAFFAEVNRDQGGREPDWEEHLAVINRSRLDGLEST
jgi:hypothetical protein